VPEPLVLRDDKAAGAVEEMARKILTR